MTAGARQVLLITSFIKHLMRRVVSYVEEEPECRGSKEEAVRAS